MKEIPLTQGFVAIIDDEDFEAVSRHRWVLVALGRNQTHVYAVRAVGHGRKGRRNQMLHQFLLGKQEGMVIDHINGNGLDCRRANLRACTQGQNCANKRRKEGCSSIYKGVSRERNRFCARITGDGHQRRLGQFETEVEAAVAYDTAARKHFGEFARLNFPIAGEQAA